MTNEHPTKKIIQSKYGGNKTAMMLETVTGFECYHPIN